MTLKDMLIADKLAGGGGGEEPSGTKQISISANGTTTHNIKDYASAEIEVAVPNSYSAGDEGKVVSSGALVSQSSDSVTQNGTVDTTLINSLTVNVPPSGWTTDGIAKGTEPSGSVVLDNTVTALASYAFANKPITNIYGPEVLTLNEGNEFRNTSQLVKAKFPKCTSVGYSNNKCTFQLSAVQYIAIPKLTGNVRSNFAQGASQLKVTDVGQTASIETKSFASCTSFDTLILRSTSLVSLANVDGIASGTKFKSGGDGGTIYIPESLYNHLGDGTANDYKAASNWATVDGYGTITWAKIEGSIYESEDWLTI